MMRIARGDYVPDGAGGFCEARGREELYQRALFLLAARRGGFAPLPTVGSRLYRLPREKPSLRRTLAKQYVEEALAEEKDIVVEDVLWEEGGSLTVTLCQGEHRLRLALSPEEIGGTD